MPSYRYVFVSSLICLSGFGLRAQSQIVYQAPDIWGLSLEELLSLEISSSALTGVRNNLSSVPMTVITARDIEVSGARSLDELLEVYVPTFVMMHKGLSSHSIGARGIISNRNDKVLLLVNGKIMNSRYAEGVFSERLTSLLGDIDRIEVMESPQSSLYGSGGISMIISIFTKGAELEEPNEVTFYQGLVDEYSNLQLRHSKMVGEDLSYSMYYGIDRARGASQENAPLRFSFSDRTYRNYEDSIIADQDITYPINNLNASNTKYRHKAHVGLNYKGLEAWVRYNKAGIEVVGQQSRILRSHPDSILRNSFGYEHFTAFSSYKKELGNGFEAEVRFSFDRLDNQVGRHQQSADFDRNEQEVYTRALLTYNTEKIGLAFGSAFSTERFENVVDTTSWWTQTISGIGEFQYLILPNLSAIAGVRLDKHTYTEALISPRAAIVWKPLEDQLIRFQYSKSTRKADDEELRESFVESQANEEAVDQNNNSESINFYELSGDLKVGEYFKLLPAAFYASYDQISFSSNGIKKLGTLNYYGLGMTISANTETHYVSLSHNYHKVHKLQLINSENLNNVSAAGYGYGNSFHNFPDHLTKLVYHYSIGDHVTLSSSLQVSWRLNGAEDAAQYNLEVRDNTPAGYVLAGSARPFETSAYMHVGCVIDDVVIPRLSASVFVYNVLGLMDDGLNKRVEFQRTSQYRIQPASLTVRVGYKF